MPKNVKRFNKMTKNAKKRKPKCNLVIKFQNLNLNRLNFHNFHNLLLLIKIYYIILQNFKASLVCSGEQVRLSKLC